GVQPGRRLEISGHEQDGNMAVPRGDPGIGKDRGQQGNPEKEGKEMFGGDPRGKQERTPSPGVPNSSMRPQLTLPHPTVAISELDPFSGRNGPPHGEPPGEVMQPCRGAWSRVYLQQRSLVWSLEEEPGRLTGMSPVIRISAAIGPRNRSKSSGRKGTP